MFPYVLYRPEKMKGPLPMIVQLHGAGEAGNGYEELYKVDIHGFSHILTQGMEYPCMFVLPQCKRNTFWVAEIQNLYGLIQRLKQEYKVDQKRIYLTGLSMGGYGTWYTAQRYPELFAAIAPVCGGGMVWRADKLDMPIWAFHGAEDETVYPTETMNMIHKIRSAGANQSEVKMTILDHVAHNAWDFAYTQELLD